MNVDSFETHKLFFFCRNQKTKILQSIEETNHEARKKMYRTKNKVNPVNFDNNRASAGTKVRLLPYL